MARGHADIYKSLRPSATSNGPLSPRDACLAVSQSFGTSKSVTIGGDHTLDGGLCTISLCGYAGAVHRELVKRHSKSPSAARTGGPCSIIIELFWGLRLCRGVIAILALAMTHHTRWTNKLRKREPTPVSAGIRPRIQGEGGTHRSSD